MNLATFRERRNQAQAQEPRYRQLCWTCRQPDFSCFCAWLKPFDPRARFVILTHPLEMRRRIATGRMSHLCLKNSKLIVGHNFSENDQVNSLLQDPDSHCLLLYPGPNAKNLSQMPSEARRSLLPKHKTPVLFVVDGTWGTARTTVNQSENLKKLPRLCFTPLSPSNFRVRQQPRVNCYSTIEAIHHTIELLGSAFGFAVDGGEHDSLLEAFDHMVNRQLALAHSVARTEK